MWGLAYRKCLDCSQNSDFPTSSNPYNWKGCTWLHKFVSVDVIIRQDNCGPPALTTLQRSTLDSSKAVSLHWSIKNRALWLDHYGTKERSATLVKVLVKIDRRAAHCICKLHQWESPRRDLGSVKHYRLEALSWEYCAFHGSMSKLPDEAQKLIELYRNWTPSSLWRALQSRLLRACSFR